MMNALFQVKKEDMMKKITGIVATVLIASIVSIGLLGCSKTATAKKVQVRWFVGLGAGSDEPTFEPQKAVVDKI